MADPIAYLDSLEAELRNIAFGSMELILAEGVFEDGLGKGDFASCPAYTSRRTRHKAVKLVTNLTQRDVDQVTVGKHVLHPRNTRVRRQCLSSIRAACVALGVKLLAHQRRRMLFIGTGRVGYYSAVLCLALGQVESMRFSDAAEGRADALVGHLAGRHPAICFWPTRPPRMKASM